MEEHIYECSSNCSQEDITLDPDFGCPENLLFFFPETKRMKLTTLILGNESYEPDVLIQSKESTELIVFALYKRRGSECKTYFNFVSDNFIWCHSCHNCDVSSDDYNSTASYQKTGQVPIHTLQICKLLIFPSANPISSDLTDQWEGRIWSHERFSCAPIGQRFTDWPKGGQRRLSLSRYLLASIGYFFHLLNLFFIWLVKPEYTKGWWTEEFKWVTQLAWCISQCLTSCIHLPWITITSWKITRINSIPSFWIYLILVSKTR